MTTLSDNAITVLERRYLKKDLEGNVIETPQDMFHRVADNIAEADRNYGASDEEVCQTAETFYGMMSRLEFLPNSPTLMNAGRDFQQLSACFVLPIEDSMESIFQTVKDTANVHKLAGGCIAAGSRVLTSDGVKKIEDVKVGDRVLSMNERTGRQSYQLVQQTHLYSPDDKTILKITFETEHNNVVTTDWHPFAVLTPEGIVFKRADALDVGDLIISGESTPNEQADADEVEYAWSLGVITSDGAVGLQPNESGVRVRVCKRYEDIIKRLSDCMGSVCKRSTDRRYKTDVYETAIYGDVARRVYDEFGGGHIDVYNKHVPRYVKNGSHCIKEAYVAGLLDGDGWYDKVRNLYVYDTVSERLFSDLMGIFSEIGLNFSYRKRTNVDENEVPIYSINIKSNYGVINRIVSLCSRHEIDNSRQHQEAVYFPKKYSYDFNIPRTKAYRKPVSVGNRTFSLQQWMNSSKISRSTLVEIIEMNGPTDEITELYLRLLPGCKIVSSVDPTDCEMLCDLTVENNNNYMASTDGQMVIIHNTGFSFSRLRPANDMVCSTRGVSSGPVSFMNVFNAATEAVKQGGMRRGANMGVLRVDHPDIMEFIEAKADHSKLTNFNISVAVTDKFMEAVENEEDFPLINPRSNEEVGRLNAREVFDRMTELAWDGGDPGVIFIDEMNRHNQTPGVGMIESCNPCGEVPLLPNESCNLASINLSKFVKTNGGIDWRGLSDTIHDAVHFLDNVIDMNEFPLPQIKEATRGNRKIGLGVMGFADMLLLLGVQYNSQRALEVAREVMEYIQMHGHLASEKLAEKRGAFPNYPDSVYEKPIRNATVTTIAPTGTISMIAGCSSGIEPLFAVAYSRHVMDDELIEVHPIFEQMAKSRGFYSEELMRSIAEAGHMTPEVPEDIAHLFVTAHDVTPEYHIRMQAAFQKFTDNAVSKTVNLPNDATVADVAKVYRLAYELGCKGVTVYRDGSREGQVLTTGKTEEDVQASPRERPTVVNGKTCAMSTGCGKLYVTLNSDDDGPFELFATMGKAGGCAASQSEALARMVSLAFRCGIPAEDVSKQLRGISCHQPAWGNGGERVLSCADAVGKAIMSLTTGEKIGHSGAPAGACPECGGVLVFESGCNSCKDCGYSKCG